MKPVSRRTEDESEGSSDGYYETLTVAYTESVVTDVSSESEETAAFTSSSSSLQTPRTLESVTSLLEALDKRKQEEAFYGYEPVWRAMSMSEGPKLHALEYFYKHSIFQLFTFLMSHLLAVTPQEPVPFLLSLVDRCLEYRSSGGGSVGGVGGDGGGAGEAEGGALPPHQQERTSSTTKGSNRSPQLDKEKSPPPPLLFMDSHVLSVYTALDPAGDGSITYSQYLNGMSTLGLTEFNVTPGGGDPRTRDVSKVVFLEEAREALLKQLDRLLGLSRSPPASLLSTATPEERVVFHSIIENALQCQKGGAGGLHEQERASNDEQEVMSVLHDDYDFTTPTSHPHRGSSY